MVNLRRRPKLRFVQLSESSRSGRYPFQFQKLLLLRQYCSTTEPSQLSPDRKSTRLNSSHANISYAVFCLKKKKKIINKINTTIRVHTICHSTTVILLTNLY